jgi:uncharacterized protein with FMN-binding domain
MFRSNPSTSACKKIALSGGFIAVSIIYVLWQQISVSVAATTILSTTPGQSYKAANEALLKTLAQIKQAPPLSQSTRPTATLTPISVPVSIPQKPAGKYIDGSYIGNAADAYYGTVQVQAIVKNGQLSDVQFLQYPDERDNSRYINGQAMPLLTQEAIQAQSAKVDGVSGATFTSQAFVKSLSAALALAKN